MKLKMNLFCSSGDSEDILHVKEEVAVNDDECDDDDDKSTASTDSLFNFIGDDETSNRNDHESDSDDNLLSLNSNVQ